MPAATAAEGPRTTSLLHRVQQHRHGGGPACWHPAARWYLDLSDRWSLGTDGALTP